MLHVYVVGKSVVRQVIEHCSATEHFS